MPVKTLLSTITTLLVIWPGAVLADSIRIVAFGDSLMAGYELDAGRSFPEQLEEALQARGHDVVISNASISGDTTSAGLARLDWSVEEGTDLVILELGANDMLRGVAPSVTYDNLDQMIARLLERNIDVVLAGMLAAPNLGTDYVDAYNAIFPDLAMSYDLTLYPFFLDGVITERSLLLEDGMHPNAEGVERMVELFVPIIEPLLSESARPSGDPS